MKLHTLFILAILSLLSACTCEEVTPEGAMTGFRLTLADKVIDSSRSTRLTPSEIGTPIATDFRITVQNSKTNRIVYNDRYAEFITAGNGDYLLTATYGEDVPLAIDQPYYKGTARASITKDAPNPAVTIPCSVANALVSVRFLDKDGHVGTSRFDDFFSSYYIKVERDGMSVKITDASQSAYIRVGAAPTLTFVGVIAETGREVQFDIADSAIPATLAPADNLVLSLSLQVATSGVVLDVTKATVTSVSIIETIPLEWLPAPRVTAFNGQSSLSHFETGEAPDDAVVQFTTCTGLQEMELSFDFEDNQYTSINKTYLLSEMTDADREALANVGIVLPEIGCSNGQIDFRNLVANMKTNSGACTTNNISMRIKSNNRWSSTDAVTHTIKVVRPEFTLPTQHEGYAWTTSLYIDPVSLNDVSGDGVDAQSVLDNMVYELSYDNGSTWTQTAPIRSGSQMLITGLDNGATYKVRARIAKTSLVSNMATQTMETPAIVPNGDFEDLHTTYSDVKLNAGGKYKVSPAEYQNTATFTVKEPTGWASVNAKTCNILAASQNTWYVNPSTYNTGISWSSYRSFGVSTENNPAPYNNLSAQSGNNAMVIRNVGWDANGASIDKSGGAFNTKYYCEKVPNVTNRSSGKMFLGSYSYENATENYNEGTGFAARPTILNGYYKYVQDGDTSEYGTVTVTLLNGSTVLGTGTQNLTACGDYGSFSVPIVYTNVKQRATSLRIMFTSSRYASYTQSVEDSKVKAQTYNNTRESAMRGAILTVDNLTFTYER